MEIQVRGYEVEKTLGEGGFGQVYLGRSPAGDLVAIKVLHEVDDQNLELRLRDEAAVLALVSTPSIPRFHELQELGEGQGLALIMEFIPGRDLYDTLDETRNLEDRLRVLQQVMPGVLDAVGLMHQLGAVHRDLKPMNIQVREPAGDGVLLDLGLAKAEFVPARTATGLVVGTPGYMAPEQFLDKHSRVLTPRTDLYQIALVIVRALESSYGDENLNDIETAVQRVSGQLDPLEGVRRLGIPAHLVRALEACLRIDVESRPESEVGLQALRSALALGSGVPAGPTSALTSVLQPLGQAAAGFAAAAQPMGRTSRIRGTAAIPSPDRAPPPSPAPPSVPSTPPKSPIGMILGALLTGLAFGSFFGGDGTATPGPPLPSPPGPTTTAPAFPSHAPELTSRWRFTDSDRFYLSPKPLFESDEAIESLDPRFRDRLLRSRSVEEWAFGQALSRLREHAPSDEFLEDVRVMDSRYTQLGVRSPFGAITRLNTTWSKASRAPEATAPGSASWTGFLRKRIEEKEQTVLSKYASLLEQVRKEVSHSDLIKFRIEDIWQAESASKTGRVRIASWTESISSDLEDYVVASALFLAVEGQTLASDRYSKMLAIGKAVQLETSTFLVGSLFDLSMKTSAGSLFLSFFCNQLVKGDAHAGEDRRQLVVTQFLLAANFLDRSSRTESETPQVGLGLILAGRAALAGGFLSPLRELDKRTTQGASDEAAASYLMDVFLVATALDKSICPLGLNRRLEDPAARFRAVSGELVEQEERLRSQLIRQLEQERNSLCRLNNN